MKMLKGLALISAFCFAYLIPLQALDISITHANFLGEKGNYVEVYFYVVGSSAFHAELENGNKQAAVEFTVTFLKNEQIVNFDKFILNGPASDKIQDFVDLKRFSLAPGTYTLKVDALDMNDAENYFSNAWSIDVDLAENVIGLSDLQLVSSFEKAVEINKFVKNGLFLESCAFNYYPQQYDDLTFYLEVYNPTADNFKASYLRYAIYTDTNKSESIVISEKYKKLKSEKIQAAILKLPIQDLSSGNYTLMVEIRNQEKMLVSVKSASFQRSNPALDLDMIAERDPSFENSFTKDLDATTIRYALKAIAPVCQGVQSTIVEELFFSDELEPKQFFIHNYFYQLNPNDPGAAYSQFMEIARAVDNTFRSNVGYGFETDRGEVFMKYGRPTEIVHVEDEPSAPPYEIWFYDHLEDSKQYNVKFIFYNPSLATNDYVLLHSNCRGERNNPRWEVELYKHAPGEQVGQNAASTQMQENYRRNARKIWEEL